VSALSMSLYLLQLITGLLQLWLLDCSLQLAFVVMTSLLPPHYVSATRVDFRSNICSVNWIQYYKANMKEFFSATCHTGLIAYDHQVFKTIINKTA